MIKANKILSAIDIATDFVPVVNSFKYLGMQLYCKFHKIDSTANPVRNSWVNDLKIHVLSKNERVRIVLALTAPLALFSPVAHIAICIGRILLHAIPTILKWIDEKKGIFNKFNLPDSIENFARTHRPHGRFTTAIKKNQAEIISLFLKARPNYSENKVLYTMGWGRVSQQSFKAIVNSRNNWSEKALIDFITQSYQKDNIDYIFQKFPDKITDNVKKAAIEHSAANLELFEWISKKFPENMQSPLLIGKCLVRAALLEPKAAKRILETEIRISYRHLKNALENGIHSRANEEEIISLIQPLMAKLSKSTQKQKAIDCGFEFAVEHEKLKVVEWFIGNYPPSEKSVGKALKELSHVPGFEEENQMRMKILEKYNQLPEMELKELLETARSSQNIWPHCQFFSLYLNHFKNISKEILQDLLDKSKSSLEKYTPSDCDKIPELLKIIEKETATKKLIEQKLEEI